MSLRKAIIMLRKACGVETVRILFGAEEIYILWMIATGSDKASRPASHDRSTGEDGRADP